MRNHRSLFIICALLIFHVFQPVAVLSLDSISKLKNKPGDIWVEPATDMAFVWVPKDCFYMGSNFGYSNEKPVHKVCLDGFWIGKNEVTQGQWEKIMGNNPSYFKKGSDYPVENINRIMVQEFIAKFENISGNRFKLPTEAQWEYAATGGNQRHIYSGSNNIDEVGWYRKNGGLTSHPIAKKKPNKFGLYDMSGNVGEWCEDIYEDNSYLKHQMHNPLFKSENSSYVVRGGSWSHKDPLHLRCSRRAGVYEYNSSQDIGFRLICLSQ